MWRACGDDGGAGQLGVLDGECSRCGTTAIDQDGDLVGGGLTGQGELQGLIERLTNTGENEILVGGLSGIHTW